MNRETWLEELVIGLTPLFLDHGYELPPVRVSTGWPSSGGLSTKRVTTGECWKPQTAADGVSQIFINPIVDDGREVAAILVHELIHAWDKGESGHRGKFIEASKDVGLKGPWTATTSGPELAGVLEGILREMPDYPHSPITPELQRPKQGTRMIKAQCPETSYLARTTKKWLEAYGAPICPCCSETMIVEVKEDA